MKKVRWKSKRANKNLREETERDHIKPHAFSSLSPPPPYLLPSSFLPQILFSLSFLQFLPPFPATFPASISIFEARSHSVAPGGQTIMGGERRPLIHVLYLPLWHVSGPCAPSFLYPCCTRNTWRLGMGCSSRMHTRLWLLSLDLSHGNGYSFISTVLFNTTLNHYN